MPCTRRRSRDPPKRAPEPGERPVSDDHVASVDLVLATFLVVDDRALQDAVAQQRPHRVGALAKRGSGSDCMVGNHHVEIAAPHDVAMTRVHRMLGPPHLERDAVGDAAQAVIAVVRGGDALLETHLPQLRDGSRRQPVAAGLLTGEGLLLDDDDVVAGPRASQ